MSNEPASLIGHLCNYALEAMTIVGFLFIFHKTTNHEWTIRYDFLNFPFFVPNGCSLRNWQLWTCNKLQWQPYTTCYAFQMKDKEVTYSRTEPWHTVLASRNVIKWPISILCCSHVVDLASDSSVLSF